MTKNLEYETEIIGSLILSPQLIELSEDLTAADFSTPITQKLYEAISSIWSDSSPETIEIAELSARANIEVMGLTPYVAGSYVPTPANFQFNVGRILKHKAQAKLLERVAASTRKMELAGEADQASLDEIQKMFQALGSNSKDGKSLGVTGEVASWVENSHGLFRLADICSDLGYVDPAQRRAASNVIGRLIHEGKVNRPTKRNGEFQKIIIDSAKIDWRKASVEPMDIKLPLGLSEWVTVYPGSILVVSGAPNSGKSAFAFDFIKQNMEKWTIDYYTNEMLGPQIKSRLMLHEDVSIDDWKFNAYSRCGDYADAITNPNGISIVDYVELNDEFWKVSTILSGIYQKVGNGVALVVLQKGFGQEMGRGGSFGLERPCLYLTLDRNGNGNGSVAKILKAKAWTQAHANPNGRILPYSLISGAKFVHDGQWTYPESREAVAQKPKLYGRGSY